MTSALNLRPLRKVFGGWLVDTVLIERDNGNADDDLNLDDGSLTSPTRPVVYNNRGAVQPVGGGDLGDPDAARLYEAEGASYRLLLPLPLSEAVEVLHGDLVRVTAVKSATAEAGIMGRRFAVTSVPPASSFAAVRFVPLRPVTEDE